MEENTIDARIGSSSLHRFPINDDQRVRDGGQGGHMVKRNVIGLVEHSSGMRVVGMTGGNVNINNGVSANLIMLKR